ncbi:MAG: hypothetical protein ACRDEA_21185, partial [Microcystaceae cyanobacterium]
VSRNFLYQQGHRAKNALNLAFEKRETDKEVTFYLPITQEWIFQLILGLVLICHSSYRGVVELLRDLFDYPISVGTIKNRITEAVEKAQTINQAQDLSAIEVGLLDEIFQGNRPVLTGVDAKSTYCFLLEEVEQRDENTWGYYLLKASEQGLNPEYTIADAGKGLRAGQKAAWGDKPCHGDVWHICEPGETLCRSLTKQAFGATSRREDLEVKMEKAKLKGIGHKFSTKLNIARQVEKKALNLAIDVKILFYWLRLDILSLAGPSWNERQELMDFIILELKIRESEHYQGIKGFRPALSHQRDNLLAFAQILDRKLEAIAQGFEIPLGLVRAVGRLSSKQPSNNAYWQEWNQLYSLLSHRF